MFQGEKLKQMSQTSAFEKGYSIVQAILAGVMVGIGYNYTWMYWKESGQEDVSPTEDKLCPNGAAWWLWIAGICLLVSSSIKAWAMMYKKCYGTERLGQDAVEVLRNGTINCGVVIAVNSFFSCAMTIVDFAMLIRGSIVVFGAWANWTDEFEAYKAKPGELNFCAHTPMMTACIRHPDPQMGPDLCDDRHHLLLCLLLRHVY